MKNLSRRLATFLISCILFLLLSSARSADLRSDYVWKPVKIGGGGWVTGMVIHPNVDNVVYCRTDVGGVYKWNSSTSQWTQLITASRMPSGIMDATDGNPGVSRKRVYTVESLAIDSSNSQVLYVASGEGNDGVLLKSTDGGASFSLLPLNVYMAGNSKYRTSGERLAVKPDDSNIVLFGSRKDGLWRSTNAGGSWTRVPSLSPGSVVGGGYPGICVIEFDPTNPEVVYASVGAGGIFRSADAGLTWSAITGTTEWAEEMEISQGVLYVCGKQAALGVRKYTPASGWSNISPAGQTKIEEIAVDLGNPNRLYAVQDGFSKLYRSINGGTSWTLLSTNNAAGKANFRSANIPWVESSNVRDWLSIGELMIDPRNPARLWFSEGMGMWRASDVSDTNDSPHFDNISEGIEEMVATDILAMPGGKTVKTTWDRIGFTHTDPDVFPGTQLGLSPTFSSGWSLATSPSDPNFVAALVTDHRYGFDGDFSGRSVDGGLSWTRFGANSSGLINPINLRFGELVVSATDTSNMVWYPRKDGTDMFYTTDGGSSWSLSAVTLTDWNSYYFGNRRRLAADGGVGGKFYFYRWTDGALLASTNSGASFTDAGGRLPVTTYWSQLKGVAGKANDLWFVTGWDHWNSSDAGVWRSINGGSSFQSFPAVESAWAIGFGKEAPGKTYPSIYIFGRIASAWGIFRSTDEGSTWDRCSDYPLGIFDRVAAISGDPDVFGKVYLGWSGNSFAYGVIASGTTPLPSNVAVPTFSPLPGTYNAAQSVTLSCATSGATIRFTTDGSNPTATSGTVYSSAIPVASTRTIKAIGVKSGMSNSAVASGLFTINNSPPPVGSGLFPNPGFEGGFPGGWDDWGNVAETSDAHGGNKAVVVAASGGFAKTVALPPGTSLDYEVFSKHTGTVDWAGFGLKFFDANMVQVGTADTVQVSAYAYTRYTGSIALPPGAKFVQIWFWCGGGSLFVDDLDASVSGAAAFPGYYRIEAESPTNTTNLSPFTVQNDATASDVKFLGVPEGAGTVTSLPANGCAEYQFELPESASVSVWVRNWCPDNGSDSVYIDVTGDTTGYANWGLGISSSWRWKKWKTVTLPAGMQTLSIKRREDGAKLDQIYLSADGSLPE